MIGEQLDVYHALGEVAPVVPVPTPVAQLAAAWLASYDSPHTRRAYERDLRAWLGWCTTVDVDPLRARRVHVDAWVRQGASFARIPAPTTLARRLAAVSAWYAYGVAEDLTPVNPVAHVRRPQVDRDESGTRGLTRDEAKAMIIMARSRMSRRDRVWILAGLLLGLRRSAVRRLDVDDLSHAAGHRVLTYTAKGGKRHTVPIPPMLADAIDAYLDGRTTGPLLVTSTGRRVDPSTLYRAVQRCAAYAGLDDPDSVTPHSLRHAFITLALDAGAPLRDVQDAAGHADPRMTRRYDRSRGRLDRHPGYQLGSYLA